MTDKTLQATEWVRRGDGMMVLRAALPEEDPQSWPSLWRKRFGEDMPRWARIEVGCAVQSDRGRWNASRSRSPQKEKDPE